LKNFHIYRSSAGSGKTYTLVKEYLKLVLNNIESVRHTLAITFTNKAADEMKSRIISSLIRLAENQDPNLLKQLKDEGVKFDIELTSRNALKYILHNYSYFSVSTIDSFFQKVIRAFAKELKLTIGYKIELDTNVVLDKVVDDVFRDIGDDEELTSYLVDFAYQNIDEEKGWHVDKNIKSLAGELFKERYWEKKLKTSYDIIDNRAKINEFTAKLKSFRYMFENKLIKDSVEALKIIASNGLEIEDFKSKRNSVAGYFNKMSKKETYSEAPNTVPYEIAKKIQGDNNGWYTKNSPKKTLIEKAVNEGLGRILEDMLIFHEMNFKKYVSVRILLKTIYTVGIFGDIIKKINEYRDLNRTLLISDSNILLRSVINEESSPFVYEKIGDYYKNFLIDEFQDTSTFQWQNILPLVLNSLSEQNYSLIVGDVKQSIYRWRNGNMMLLLRSLELDLSRFKEYIQIDNLTTNYRSKVNVIEFNNRLFELIPGLFAEIAETGDTSVITMAYENAKQENIEKYKGGYVKAEFIPYEKGSGQSANYKAGLRLVEIVKQLISDGVNPSDILILTRKKDELREVSLLLNSSGFPVISDESLLLINSPKVKLLVSIFRYLVNREDKFAKAEALYNFMILNNHIEQGYDNIFRMVNESFDSLVKSKIDIKEISNRSLYELTEYLIRTFGLNNKADLYLLRFLDVILEYSSKQSQELNSFIRWWDDMSVNYSIIVSGQSRAIRLMTIHKAKGLESTVVIVPYANWEINISGSRDHIWVSSDDEPFNESSSYLVKAGTDLKESYFASDYNNEFIMTNLDNLNLLYVALTRAKERLYLISPQKGISTKNINTILNSVFESDEWFKSIKTTDNVYEFGTGEKIKKSEEKKQNITEQSVVSCDFRNRTVIKPFHEKLSISAAETYINSLNRGILLHKALSCINTIDDAESAILKVKSQGLLDENFEDDLRNEIRAILNDNNVSEWFKHGGNIKIEAEIITDDPDKPVIRPDRVLIDGKNIKLLDYKTGKEKDDDKKQLQEYTKILKHAGYDNVETYLYYLENKKIVRVI